jgi:hypothetical protein
VLKMMNDPNVKRSAASFYDGFISLSHRFKKNNITDFVVYNSNDYFRFSQQFAYRWTNTVVNSKISFGTDKKISPSLSFAYGRYNSTLINPSGIQASQLSNIMNYLQVKGAINYLPNDRHTVAVGFESVSYLPDREIRSPYNNNTSVSGKSVEKNNGIELAFFANETYEISEMISITAGLRYSQYTHLGSDTIFHYDVGQSRSVNSINDTTYHSAFESIHTFRGLEPRLSIRVGLSANHSIKAGYNRMRQYIHQISNSAAPTPVDLWQVSTQHIRPQMADNFSAGYFVNFDNNAWETSIEGFFKTIQNLVEYKDFPELYVNNHLETELLSGKGEAYGIELYIRKIKGKWTGWASYTYSRSLIKVSSVFDTESINNGNWFPSNFDKPHSFNLVVDRKLRKNGAISIIGSYNTGRPFTAIESSYINEGTVIPIYSQRNEYRIPNYLRFDFSFTIGNVVKKLDDSLVFSIYNLMGRDNAYSVFYVRPNPNIYGAKPYRLSVLGSALPSLTYNFKF